MTAKKKSSQSKKKKLEKAILTILESQSTKTLILEDLIKELNFSQDLISQAVRNLEKDSKVRTKLVMQRSQWVTSVKKIQDFDFKPKDGSKVNKLEWKPINDIPCFICPYALKCAVGAGTYNPHSCAYLTDWLICSIDGEKYTGNPFHPEYTKEEAEPED